VRAGTGRTRARAPARSIGTTRAGSADGAPPARRGLRGQGTPRLTDGLVRRPVVRVVAERPDWIRGGDPTILFLSAQFWPMWSLSRQVCRITFPLVDPVYPAGLMAETGFAPLITVLDIDGMGHNWKDSNMGSTKTQWNPPQLESRRSASSLPRATAPSPPNDTAPTAGVGTEGGGGGPCTSGPRPPSRAAAGGPRHPQLLCLSQKLDL